MLGGNIAGTVAEFTTVNILETILPAGWIKISHDLRENMKED